MCLTSVIWISSTQLSSVLTQEAFIGACIFAGSSMAQLVEFYGVSYIRIPSNTVIISHSVTFTLQ